MNYPEAFRIIEIPEGEMMLLQQLTTTPNSSVSLFLFSRPAKLSYSYRYPTIFPSVLFAIFRLFFDIPTPTGKNDGSVRGERYFTCPRGHELSIRENNITRVLSQPATRSSAAKAAAPAATTKTTKSCPSSVITTTSTIQTSPICAPICKASIAGSSTASTTVHNIKLKPTQAASYSSPMPAARSNAAASSASAASKASRDTASIETLNTKI
ncbi:hypothetical protein HBH56_147530 [Parastagonospora nodorum]|nr:hypothetical protein HBH56_147530 [Parastagonospora nodorum]KAH3923184.1 hypothetical protein HBH54_212170 [Parastagonospora nodorum]KAH4028720.1 hypothetical protein HBI13_039400 [Parastagonospora nodorum]KAH4037614.1 hypothetical protein HBI09_056590 [Parastagonospora nodorum]KAH4273070.1 hypothetical protein HBI04_133220 [Parastagonospora nodorum]